MTVHKLLLQFILYHIIFLDFNFLDKIFTLASRNIEKGTLISKWFDYYNLTA